jgi:hypothetical protein
MIKINDHEAKLIVVSPHMASIRIKQVVTGGSNSELSLIETLVKFVGEFSVFY